MRLLRLLLFPVLAGTALPLRAQVALPVLSSYALPTGNSFIIGVTAGSNSFPSEKFRLFTIADFWASYSVESATWTKVGQANGIQLNTQSLVAAHPTGQSYLYTGRLTNRQTLFEYDAFNGAITPVDLGVIGNTTGLTVAPDQRFYISTASDIRVYPDLATGLPTTVISNFGAEALGSLGAQLSFVNNTLYAFDQTNQRVLRYDANGNFLAEFAVGHGSSGSSFAVSSTDLIFTADFYDGANPTGSIYRASTGDLLGYFDLPHDIDEPTSNGGRPVLAVVGDLLIATSGTGANVYLYDLSAVPEPSTYTAIFGVLALGFAAWRRRRRQSNVNQSMTLRRRVPQVRRSSLASRS